MVRPIDPDVPVEYIAQVDKDLPEPDQTIWLVKPLEAKALAKLEDNLAEGQSKKKGGGLKLKSGTHVLDALKAGLHGVRNFGGEDIELHGLSDKELRTTRDGLFRRIPPAVRRELAEVITGDADLDEDEVGN